MYSVTCISEISSYLTSFSSTDVLRNAMRKRIRLPRIILFQLSRLAKIFDENLLVDIHQNAELNSCEKRKEPSLFPLLQSNPLLLVRSPFEAALFAASVMHVLYVCVHTTLLCDQKLLCKDNPNSSRNDKKKGTNLLHDK